jgi:hypothetical protein
MRRTARLLRAVLTLALVLPASTASPASRLGGGRTAAGSAASLEIVATGLPGRDAVKQLQDALEILGYKVNTIENIIGSGGKEFEQQLGLWVSAYRDNCASMHNASFIKSAFTDYGSTAAVGFPAQLCWEELVQANPHVKIIHFEAASAEAWWDEAYETYLTLFRLPHALHWYKLPLWASARIHMGLSTLLFQKTLVDFYEDIIMSAFAGAEGGTQDAGFPLDYKGYLIERYRKNNAKARSLPKTSLLVHDHADGWPKLCAFLGKPIPTMRYPATTGVLGWAMHAYFNFLPFFAWGLFVYVFLFLFVAHVALREVQHLVNIQSNCQPVHPKNARDTSIMEAQAQGRDGLLHRRHAASPALAGDQRQSYQP